MGLKTSVHGQMTLLGGVRVLESHAPTALTGRRNLQVLAVLKTELAGMTAPAVARVLSLDLGQVQPRLAELRRLGFVRKQEKWYSWTGKEA